MSFPDTWTYTPPKLPAYLSNTFTLQPVVGVPKDEDVLAIHAVIHKLKVTSQIPELHDPGVSMGFSQHLFDLQMARYRDRYPLRIFPSDILFTPPTLPTHIPIQLEPVHGPPTDDQIKSVQSALSLSETFIHVPSVYDAHLYMSLSQHMFDLQLARHIQYSTQGRYASPVEPSQEGNNKNEAQSSSEQEALPRDAESSSHTDIRDISSTREDVIEGNTPSGPRLSQSSAIDSANVERVLVEISDTLTAIRRSLHMTQKSMIRGFNMFAKNGHCLQHALNEDGELPRDHGLYCHGHVSQFRDEQLAPLLQFYKLTEWLVPEAEQPTVKEGKRHQVMNALGHCMF